jgi:mannosyltransferase
MRSDNQIASLKQRGAVWNDWRLWFSVIVGLTLRLYRLGDNSLWFDEGFSVAWANSAVPELLHRTLLAEPHPPTYYLMLHYWITAFGASPVAIRMLSVIFGTATIFVVFEIGATLSDRKLGGVGSFLLAISPLHIQYSTEARMYAQFAFAAAFSVWGAALFMRNMAQRQPLRKAAIILVIGISLMLASHNTGVLVWAAISTTLLIIWLLDGQPQPAFRYGLIFNGIIAILFLCWLPLLLEQWQIAKTATAWMPPLGLKVAAEALGPLFAPKIEQALSYRAAAATAAAVVLIALAGAYFWRHDRRAVLFCVLIGILPITLSAVVSLAKPIFVTDIFLPSLIPLDLFVAMAMIACRSPIMRAGIIAVVAFVNLAGLYGYYFRWQTEDWRTAVSTITKAMHTQDIVVMTAPLAEMVIGYYAPQLPSKITLVVDVAAVGRLAEAASGHRVWQIATAWHDQVNSTSIARALDQDHTVLRSVPVNLIKVTLWDPRN